MQYLKDEIRKRIIIAALGEFMQKGYEEASMRLIAHEADVALGSLYRYFKNKDELFNVIMEPAYKEYTSLVKGIHTDIIDNGDLPFLFKGIVDQLMEVYKKYSVEFLILIDKSKGSRYERTKEELIVLVEDRLRNGMIPELFKKGIELKDPYFSYVIAVSVVEGFIIILRKYTDEERIQYLVHQLITFHFNKVQERFI